MPKTHAENFNTATDLNDTIQETVQNEDTDETKVEQNEISLDPQQPVPTTMATEV